MYKPTDTDKWLSADVRHLLRCTSPQTQTRGYLLMSDTSLDVQAHRHRQEASYGQEKTLQADKITKTEEEEGTCGCHKHLPYAASPNHLSWSQQTAAISTATSPPNVQSSVLCWSAGTATKGHHEHQQPQDKPWTLTTSGQTMNINNLRTNHEHQQPRDKPWTSTTSGQTMNINNLRTNHEHQQPQDKPWTSTTSGQTMNINNLRTNHEHQQPQDKPWTLTTSGQTMNINNLRTNHEH